MFRNVLRATFLAIFTAVSLSTNFAWAVAPNPLENAYWRFEEGTAATAVDSSASDPVHDTANLNHLNAFNSGTSPQYTTTVAPTPLKSGATNNLALGFDGNDDLYTLVGDGAQGLGKHISNGYVVAGGGFTIEAAFRPDSVAFPGSTYQAIIAKEGEPADNGAAPKTFVENLPTLVLKVRGDTGVLQFEEFDAAKNQVSVSSLNPMVGGQWYYAAVVNDGSSLKLYLDSTDGNGYQLQSTIGVNGAFYQGPNPADPGWDFSWTVGRGFFNGGADWFTGIIDEVRVSNTALAPSDFLFAPAALAGDYNGDHRVDGADYVKWRDTDINGAQGYADWRAHYGETSPPGLGSGSSAVPEPAGIVIIAIGLVGLAGRRVHPLGRN